MQLVPRILLCVTLTASVAIMGCDPCRNLAEKICECEKNSTARDNCRRSLSTLEGQNGFGSAVKSDVCREILKSEACTCQAIDEGRVENCGMTR